MKRKPAHPSAQKHSYKFTKIHNGSDSPLHSPASQVRRLRNLITFAPFSRPRSTRFFAKFQPWNSDSNLRFGNTSYWHSFWYPHWGHSFSIGKSTVLSPNTLPSRPGPAGKASPSSFPARTITNPSSRTWSSGSNKIIPNSKSLSSMKKQTRRRTFYWKAWDGSTPCSEK